MLTVFESARGGKKKSGLTFYLSDHSDDPISKKMNLAKYFNVKLFVPSSTHSNICPIYIRDKLF
jgi:hypothetical protein